MTDAQIDALWAEACKRDQPTRDMVRAFARAAIAAAQPVPDTQAAWNEGFKHGQWLAKNGAAAHPQQPAEVTTGEVPARMSEADEARLHVALGGVFGWKTAHPQQPARVPLTDEQIDNAVWHLGFGQLSPREVARAIEAAHGIVPAPTTDTCAHRFARDDDAPRHECCQLCGAVRKDGVPAPTTDQSQHQR